MPFYKAAALLNILDFDALYFLGYSENGAIVFKNHIFIKI